MDKKVMYDSVKKEVRLYVMICIDFIISCGMSQKDLASFLDVSPALISLWKNGKCIPSTLKYISLHSLYQFLRGEGGVFKHE